MQKKVFQPFSALFFYPNGSRNGKRGDYSEDFDEAGEYGEDYGGGEYDDAALHDGLIEHEARRIVERMKGLDRLNSPNKSYFMVEIALAFMVRDAVDQ